MKKGLLVVLVVVSVFLFLPKFAFGQINCITTRCASCDLCGYCLGKPPPEDWIKCRDCIYPAINSPAQNNETLAINVDQDPTTLDLPPTPASGRYYTQIGCINTNVSSFTNPAAVGGVVNIILNSLFFPLVGGLALIFIIYGAFLLLTSQDNPERKLEGKRIITGALIGSIFTFSAVLIVTFIASNVLRLPGFEKGSNIKMTVWGTNRNYIDDNDEYPRLQVLVNNVVVTEMNDIGPTNKTIEKYIPIKIKNGDIVKIIFINDLCCSDSQVPYGFHRCSTNIPVNNDIKSCDRNAYISMFEVDGRNCNSFNYHNNQSWSGNNLQMNWGNEEAVCTSWSN